jgi:hypothetical protein
VETAHKTHRPTLKTRVKLWNNNNNNNRRVEFIKKIYVRFLGYLDGKYVDVCLLDCDVLCIADTHKCFGGTYLYCLYLLCSEYGHSIFHPILGSTCKSTRHYNLEDQHRREDFCSIYVGVMTMTMTMMMMMMMMMMMIYDDDRPT